MNLDELNHFESTPSGSHRIGVYPYSDSHASLHSLKAHSLSSTPSENDWISPFTLPPLPTLRRDRDPQDYRQSPDYPRQRDGSGAYYAAAWGSPYATPSPRRAPQPFDPASQRLNIEAGPPFGSSIGRRTIPSTPGDDAEGVESQSRRRLYRRTRLVSRKELRNPRSERPNWLSDSEESGSETGVEEEDNTPTRVAYLDSWGASPVETVSRLPVRHRSSESLATITPYTFHDSRRLSIAPERHRMRLSPSAQYEMAEHDSETAPAEEKPLPVLPPQTSHVEDDGNAPESPTSVVRPRPTSMQSYQRPKKKVIWKGKACIIALPLTDREAAGLPPLLTPQQVKERIDGWIAAGYSVEGFGLTGTSPGASGESSGQSRPVYPDATEIQAERKLREFHVRIPDQAEWESWVNYLKEEKLRALGVSPSNSEAAPSSRSPFSPALSRISSGYPALATSPPGDPSSSSASNPLRAASNPFSPSNMSSAAISPQPGSLGASQFNGAPKHMHGYKPSIAQSNFHGRIPSPLEASLTHTNSFGNGARPNIQPLSSRQNSFSPNHPLLLPNMGEVLSQPQAMHMRRATANFAGDQGRQNQMQQRGYFPVPQNANQPTPSPTLPQRIESLVHTPQFSDSSRTPIEIAHPTPKSHRHNLSIALQREIDEAEAALHERGDGMHEDPDLVDLSLRKDSALDESVNEEPPILRRPETITTADEKSEIETNPSIAATPMLMDDKNPFVNWQALSDAAKAEPKPTPETIPTTSKLNVEAKEFDPRAGFSSSNFSFAGPSSIPFGLPPPKVAPSAERAAFKSRLSLSHLNADAPAFTPRTTQPAPKDTPFTFSSATFNVEAPVFNPSQSPDTNFKDNVASTGTGPSDNANSIFGNVVIDPGSKAIRRASKGIPTVGLKSKDVQEEGTNNLWDDAGRPMVPMDRQKRARRNDSDGDRSPVFADSAPFHHRRILSEIVDDVDANGPNPEVPKKSFDGWAYISADENQLTGTADMTNAQEETSDAGEPRSAFTFKNHSDAALFSEARPPLEADQILNSEQTGEATGEAESSDNLKKEEETPVKPTTLPSGPTRKPKSSLSALAKPFEFNTRVTSSLGSSSFAMPQKTPGLEDSKYAETSSPPSELKASLSSPVTDIPHYVEKDHESVNEVEDTVEVFEEKSSEDEVVEVIEEKSAGDEFEQPRRRKYILEPAKDFDTDPDAGADRFDKTESSLRHGDQPVPSFEEIDAVMKHLEVHPELGVERNDTPVQSTPLVDMRLGGHFRSDAPSPSPVRHQDTKAAQSDTSYPPSYGLGIGVHNLNSGREDVSDWGDTLPAAEAAKLQLRSQFFDGHVNDLVDGLLENRLGPLERTLRTIQHSLALMATQQNSKTGGRGVSGHQKDSDADDEDEYDAFEGFSSYRTRSPNARRGERKQDLIRAAVAEALAAHQPPPLPQPSMDLTEFSAILQEMRELAQKNSSQNTQHELKTIMEDVISHHPRLRGSRVQQEHETADIKYKPQIDGLETMLKISQEHAAEEARLRRTAEEEINELKLRLRIAEEEAAQYRESSEEAQHTLEAFVEEKDSYRNLEREVEGLTLKNTALEHTLEEYRVSSDQWREDIRTERASNKELKRTLQELHQQLVDQSQSRQNLRSKVERLQSHIAQVVEDLHSEQQDWRNKEHDLQSKLARLQDALEQERRHREKAELELDTLDREHKANIHLKTVLDQAQLDVSRLNELVASLREENRALDTKAFNLDRELEHVKNSKDAELATSTAKLQAELESALTKLQSIQADSTAQISRLQSRLDHAELDNEEQKAKHDALLAEIIETHKEALREANEKKENALEDQHQVHEKKLNELRDRHTRELHNSFDTRTRLEHQSKERLELSEDKVKHLESKVADLEERLEITKSAARAAVEAATAKGVNLPTPAPSVVASPPQRAATASMSFAKGSDVPERISPQALRESIMVLQDQLQNREQKIEQLETELAAVDKDAPNRLRERDTEIGWLRELLSVRIDDLEDIINAVSRADFDRDTVRDAAIRLKANLQMEQQLKERGAAGGLASSFPSISSLSSYAQSPRALPLAAAAAWGNWRRARETSIGAISDLATNLGNQTPSKSAIGSPASFLSGIITPPGTTQKTPSSSQTPTAPPPSMRNPPAGTMQARKAGGPEARPLRAYSSQPRALSSRQADKRPENLQLQPNSSPTSQLKIDLPQTPIQAKDGANLDLTDDVDDDASPLDGKNTQLLGEAEPLVE
ncbi:uncharacterized protein Z520_11285 [Fonsecaea multimorphosa CBS 102226]|uniref:Myosin class II heavy chain n=1 Tax=Fonsecaea multimorphosa CBS 102226 TaxID=1442371 RepID=A0A0D2JIL6_9EURO|nr:uncharacterized protein Z520_11285 [Fonsecaea multimorphosa CBS 102226]KIX93012.1 hypothetical protein Z520_11285 [Fonsecaea multimorphosa CBS 102226]OAL18261.1 hypothetical protein AYO22_10839 [Fonsecaea multimorphosa]